MPDGDDRAPGGAVTVQLCGYWEHDGPCRWPHHSAAERAEGHLTVRTVFAADPADEAPVRERIRAAMRSGHLMTPDHCSSWQLLAESPAALTSAEAELAASLLATLPER